MSSPSGEGLGMILPLPLHLHPYLPGIIRAEAYQPLQLIQGPWELKSCMQGPTPDTALNASTLVQGLKRIFSTRTSSHGQKRTGRAQQPSPPRKPTALPSTATCRTSAVLATEDPCQVWLTSTSADWAAWRNYATVPSQEQKMLILSSWCPPSHLQVKAFPH